MATNENGLKQLSLNNVYSNDDSDKGIYNLRAFGRNRYPDKILRKNRNMNNSLSKMLSNVGSKDHVYNRYPDRKIRMNRKAYNYHLLSSRNFFNRKNY